VLSPTFPCCVSSPSQSHHFTTPKPPPGKFTWLAVSFSHRPSIAAWHAGLHICELFTPPPVFESDLCFVSYCLKLKVHVRELLPTTLSSGCRYAFSLHRPAATPTPASYACWCSLLLSVSPLHFACYAYLPPSYQPPWTPRRPAKQSPQLRR
jgi:hypothetical protein